MNQHKIQELSSSATPRHGIARDVFAVIYFGFALFTMIVYPVVGFAMDHGCFDWFFTGEVFGPARITFLQAIMDVDQLFANFVTIILFCFMSAFFFVNYGQSRVEIKDPENIASGRKAAGIFGLGSIAIFGIAVIMSYAKVVNVHPEFAGQGLLLVFSNFYPENFSVHALYYAFLFSGFPGIFYLIASGNLGARQLHWTADRSRKNPGIFFMVIAVAIFEIVVLGSPFVWWDMINAGTAIRETVFSLFDVLFVTGLVLLVERKREDPIKNQEKVPRGTIPRYWIHELAWAIPVIAVLGIVGYLLASQSLTVQLGVAYYLSRAWNFGFTVFFTMFLYYFGNIIKNSNHVKEAT